MAAARGLLPFSNEELLESLVALTCDEDPGVRNTAAASIDTLEPDSFAALAAEPNTPPDVLGFLCLWPRAPREVVEAAIFNRATPDSALVILAGRTKDASIIEAISVKQQSLIRTPGIIEAILANPARSFEAERRASEVRQEFFEKEFGAQLVADEQRVRQEAEANARAAEERRKQLLSVEDVDDLIRLGLIEEGIDDSLIAEYESEFGPFDERQPEAHEVFDISPIVEEIHAAEMTQITTERMPVFQQIALMSVKDRVLLAIKGTREARLILVRDPNRLVASAVMRNPRLTDNEVEYIASIKSVHEDVLRQIGMHRGWVKSYAVIHNLVRNPRSPIAISLGFLNRIQTRDLRALSLNKNIPDVIRQTANRVYIKRTGN
ncbi:MAG TPA: hypothetical protein VKA60_11370 [Blastocatellia bacterium]|nr:hypothetical protein [Blastocatellia bacterium]